MSFLSPGFLLIALTALVIWAIGGPASKRANLERARLSAEDLKNFQDQYRSKSSRATMPTKFKAFADAADKASRAYLFGVFALIAAISAVLFLGNDLGLSLRSNP